MLMSKFLSRISSFKNNFILYNRLFCSSNQRANSFEAKEINDHIRLQLAAAYRGFEACGLNEGICNHLTALAPSSNGNEEIMLVIPYGLHWSEVTPANLIGVNKALEVVEGKGNVEKTAISIHTGIYRSRKDIKTIMHTHVPYATTLACLKDPSLRMIHQNSTRFFDQIAYDTNFNGLGNDIDEALRMGKILGLKNCLMLGSHGVIIVSNKIATAFDSMYYLECAAKIQVLAMSTGQELREIPQEIVQVTSNQFREVMDRNADQHLQFFIRKYFSKSF